MQRLSQSELCVTLKAGNFKGTSDSLPSTVKNAVGQPPIVDVIKVVGKSAVVRYIEFELIRMSSLVSVGGNLNNTQVEFIAVQMVDLFPAESLADFKLCFERGCMGQYGEIFRMDGIVIRKWMEQYLNEKYELIEAELKAEKKAEQDAEYTGPGYESFKKYADELRAGMNKVPGMDEKDVRKYGQEKPIRTTVTAGYAWFNVRGVDIYASTQEHAEELAALAFKAGKLEEF